MAHLWKLDFIRGNRWWFLSCHPSTIRQFENFIFEVDSIDGPHSYEIGSVIREPLLGLTSCCYIALRVTIIHTITNNIALYWIFFLSCNNALSCELTTVIKDHFPNAKRGRYPRWSLIPSTGYGKIRWRVIKESSSSTL